MTVESTWHPREMPVLLKIYECERAGAPFYSNAVGVAIGLPEADVRASVAALTEAGYVVAAPVARSSAYIILPAPRLTERGRRQVGQWPHDGYDAVVTLVETRITTATDEAERTRLRAFLGGLVGMGRDVATDVLSAIARDLAGLR